MIKLTLPLPPSANRYHRYVNGRVLKSREAREYLEACQLAVVAQYGGPLIEGRVRIRMDVYRDLRADLDNHVKQLMDALEGSVILNDSQCWDLHMVRHLDRDNPRIEVEVAAVTGGG